MVERDNMSTSNDSLTERVQNSFKQLSVASSQLNAVSDELGKLIAQLESELKKLNLGIEGWVQIDGGSSDPNGHEWWSRNVGYAKVDGKWGIALRSASGDVRSPEYDDSDTKLFNEAPRDLRIAAIDKIPDLLEKLSAAAEATTKEIKGKLGKVQQVVAAVSAAAPRK
jgi:hypothetical protein